MKRKVLLILGLLFSVVTLLGVLAACGGGEEESEQPGEEAGEYYCDYNGTEYSLTLGGETCTFKLTMGTTELSGGYVLTNDTLTLTPESAAAISATYKDEKISFIYSDVSYTFLRKVEYTVTFNTNGGSAVDAVKVVNGRTAAKPTDPKNGEKVFVGWYTDNNTFRNLYYFSQPVTGDLTLYARFVDMIDPEFKVTFDAGEEAAAIAPRTTVGHKLFDLPTPERADDVAFVGWYVSQFNDGEKLSYRYEAEMPIDENLTLYAVWDEGKPAFTVGADGIHILNAGVGTRYNIAITAPGDDVPETHSDTAALYAYDFTSKAEGEYTISVTIDNETTTLHYINKALARVSVFEVEESTILFNGVPYAEKYLLTVVCGSEGHEHEEIEVTNRSWSFANCEMPADGFVFTVKVMADGYVTSESEPYTFTRTLKDVDDLAIDETTETVTWSAVEKATSYFVTVKEADETDAVYAENIGNLTSFSLKSFAEGDYTVEVKALARGWKASAGATITYQKDRLATPEGLQLNGNELTWEAVTGADKYFVTVDGTDYPVEGGDATTFSLDEAKIDEAAESVEVSVRAAAADRTDSLATDPITLRVSLGDLTYEKGMVKWDAVIGAESYTVTVNENEPVSVDSNSYRVTLDQEGNNVIKVSVADKADSEKTITVTAYKITFDPDGAEVSDIVPQYLADGDPIDFPAPELRGHTFEAWYTAPGGSNGEGVRYDDAYFGDKQNRTLYGAWYANEYTLTFNTGRYGKGQLESVKIRYGEKITLPVPESNNVNYAFSGWCFTSDQGVKVSDYKGTMDSVYTQETDSTLYAAYVTVFEFSEDPSGIAVSKGVGITQGIVAEVTIPSIYNGRSVTRLLDFSNCPKLEVINMPDTIQLITLGTKASAFNGDTALRAINVYSTYGTDEVVYSSDDGVLIYDDPRTLRKELCFFPFAKSGEYTVPDGVAAIISGAFRNANALTKLNISFTVTEVQMDAITSCAALESVVFLPTPAGAADSVLDLRQNAFGSCDELTSIHLPARLETFDPTAFDQLDNFAELTVDAGGKYSAVDGLLCVDYDGDVSGKEIVFAPRGKDLGEYTIPTGVVSIGARAFYDHPRLTKIIIPGYVVNIGASAFESSNLLEGVEFQGVENDYDLTIAEKAFYGVDSSTSTSPSWKFTSVRLPANLKNLGKNAFGGWYKLTEVWVDAARDAVNYAEGAFLYTPSNVSYIVTVHIGEKCPAFSYAGVFGNRLANVDVAQNNLYVKSEENVIFDADGESILFFPMDKGGQYTIPDTVKTIGASTFASRAQLTKVIVPKSVETIGASAFKDCTKLDTVEFVAGAGEALTIGDEAFYRCTKLAHITLPERLTHLGKTVFYNCDSLNSINLPKNLAQIDKGEASADMGGGERFDLFDECDNLTSITVDAESQYFSASQGVLYKLQKMGTDANNHTVRYVPYEVLYCLRNASGDITVPGTVRIVDQYAFTYIPEVNKITFQDMEELYYENGERDATEYTFQKRALDAREPNVYNSYNTTLTEIVLPKGLRTIGDELLYHWEGLLSITIPNTVTSISSGAFVGCYGLSTVTFEKGGEEDLVLEDGTYTASRGSEYRGVFSNYNTNTANGKNLPLDTIELPARTKKIGAYAFAYSPITSVTFEGAVTGLVIGKQAFYYCTKLTNIVIPEGVVSIGDNAYTGAASEVEEGFKIELPSTLTSFGDGSLGSSGMFGELSASSAPITEIDFSKATKLTKIGTRALAYMPSLETVKFAAATDASPELTISEEAFYKDEKLNNVTIPANVVTIGINAFKEATGLASITFATYGSGEKSGKSALKEIGETAFQKTGLTSFEFPVSAEENGLTLGQKLFAFCTSLTSVTLSASVHSIASVFQGCASIETITIAGDNEYFKTGDEDAVLYDKTTGKDILLIYKSKEGTYTIQNGATKIGASAFYGQTEITKVVIPASVVEIGDSAFEGCVNLTEVEFKASNSLTTIGLQAFQYCYKLQTVNFDLCTNLSTIKTKAFAYTAIEQIDLSKATKLTTFQYTDASSKMQTSQYVFAYNNALQSVKLPDGLTFLGTNTFRGCDGITEIDISNTSIEHLSSTEGAAATGTTYLFACANLQKVWLPSGLKSIGSYVFYGATNLKEVYIGGKESNAVANDLTKVATFSNGSFQNSGIPSVKLSGSATFATSASAATFMTCTKLTTVEFTNPTSLTAIPQSMFSGCSSLATLNFTDLTGLTSIGKEAFKGCAFTAVDLSHCAGSANFLGSSSTNTGIFQDCTKLTSISIPDSVTVIGNYAFSNTGFVTLDLSIFNNIATWGNNVFNGCQNLERVKPFGDDYKTTTLQANLFSNCPQLEEIDLSNTKITELAKNMFDGCTSLTTVKLPATLTYIAQEVFKNCVSLRTLDLSMTALTITGASKINVTPTASGGSFDGCENLETVKLPKTLVKVGGQTFRNCTSLQNFGDFDFSQLVQIGTEAFANCAAIKGTVTLNENLALLGESAFTGCMGITDFVVPETSSVYVTSSSVKGSLSSEGGMLVFTATSDNSKTILAIPGTMEIVDGNTLKLTGDAIIGKYLFRGFDIDGITKLDLSELNMETVPSYAFYGAPFTEIVLPDTVTTINGYAFEECVNLTTVNLPDTLTSLGLEAFQNCAQLTHITLPEGVTEIKNHAFAGTGFTTFDIPAQITTIGNWAFQNSKLTSITIPATVSSLGHHAFEGCADLVSATFEGDLTVTTCKTQEDPLGVTGSFLFRDCTQLKTVDYSNRTVIYAYEFYNSGLEQFAVPASVVTINDNAFRGATQLQTVTLSEGLTKIGANAFQDSGLTGDIVIPETVTSIGANAFNNCTAITSITLSASCGTLPETVFAGWVEGQQINFYESRYAVAAVCGVAWLNGLKATVNYEYEAE